MKKNQTNEQLLRKLISANSPMENALLRERIIKVMELTIEDMGKNPNEWRKGFIAESLIVDLSNNVNKIIGFNN
jgi:hypothetical protein